MANPQITALQARHDSLVSRLVYAGHHGQISYATMDRQIAALDRALSEDKSAINFLAPSKATHLAHWADVFEGDIPAKDAPSTYLPQASAGAASSQSTFTPGSPGSAELSLRPSAQIGSVTERREGSTTSSPSYHEFGTSEELNRARENPQGGSYVTTSNRGVIYQPATSPQGPDESYSDWLDRAREDTVAAVQARGWV